MKLHIGCGKRFLPGFKHVDIENYPHIDFQIPMHDLSLIDDSSVSEIYSSHAFEYYDREFAKVVLLEWFRVLKPQGCLYLTVPNFEALIEIYASTKNLKTILGPLFGQWHNPNLGETIYHKTVYDKKDLKNSLLDVGFRTAVEFNPARYLMAVSPEYDDYSLAYFPHMDPSGIQVSIAIKATKP